MICAEQGEKGWNGWLPESVIHAFVQSSQIGIRTRALGSSSCRRSSWHAKKKKFLSKNFTQSNEKIPPKSNVQVLGQWGRWNIWSTQLNLSVLSGFTQFKGARRSPFVLIPFCSVLFYTQKLGANAIEPGVKEATAAVWFGERPLSAKRKSRSRRLWS